MIKLFVENLEYRNRQKKKGRIKLFIIPPFRVTHYFHFAEYYLRLFTMYIYNSRYNCFIKKEIIVFVGVIH